MNTAGITEALIDAAGRPWALAEERVGPRSALIADVSLGREFSRDRLARVAGANDLGRGRAAETKRIGRGREMTAIVRIHGLLLYSLDFPPFVTSVVHLADWITFGVTDGDGPFGDLVAGVRFLEAHGAHYPFAELVSSTFPLAQADRAFQHAVDTRAFRVAVVP